MPLTVFHYVFYSFNYFKLKVCLSIAYDFGYRFQLLELYFKLNYLLFVDFPV